MQTVMEFRQSMDRLKEDETMPTMTIFDVQLATKNELGVFPAAEVKSMLEMAIENKSVEHFKLLPGPWDGLRTKDEQVAYLREVSVGFVSGYDVFQYAGWQTKYGDRGLSSNIIVPLVLATGGAGSERRFYVGSRVILGNAPDAERISRTHVRKEGNFEATLLDGIIATTDNDHWRAQRRHLSEVFLPLSSLAEIMPSSLGRAKACAERLRGLAAGGTAVDMSDFLLHEAQAQLQLALLGAPESLMDATNEDIRATFLGAEGARIGALAEAMKSLMEAAQEDTTLALPTDGRPVRGPLSRAVTTSNMKMSTNYGNMLLILFAGHDTTGHTMTWLLFELARNPEAQKKVIEEIANFFKELGGRDPTYRDLARLPYLDRCLTETLRMWPAVANGTYRQLQFEDHVTGPGGKPVLLPKGTFVNIGNWSRHRNHELWGSDADEFKPDRDFKEGEIGRVGCPMAAVNIQSERFSPFSHNPRSCLGRNFAQMEMRLIMLYLFRDFDFTLAQPYDKLMGAKLGASPDIGEFRGINRATMGPMDLEKSTQCSWGTRHAYALKMHARPRAA